MTEKKEPTIKKEKKKKIKPTPEMQKYNKEVNNDNNNYWNYYHMVSGQIKDEEKELEIIKERISNAVIGFGNATKILTEKQEDVEQKKEELKKKLTLFKEENPTPLMPSDKFEIKFGIKYWDVDWS